MGRAAAMAEAIADRSGCDPAVAAEFVARMPQRARNQIAECLRRDDDPWHWEMLPGDPPQLRISARRLNKSQWIMDGERTRPTDPSSYWRPVR